MTPPARQQWDPTTFPGLTEAEAAARLKEEGFNELPTRKRRSFLALAWEVVREPMFLLLLACGGIYLVLGDVHEAMVLLGFVFVVMGITFYQERKTERALEALRDLSSPRALVVRDGSQKRIAGREVVRGDILLLAEGDRVPADAVLLWASNLAADESLLTGESVPVRKVALKGETGKKGRETTSAETARKTEATGAMPTAAPEGLTMGRPGGDDLPFVYSGTLIVQGQGVARVLATGSHTEIGKIGKALQTVEPEETTLQRETGKIVRKVAILGVSLCALVVIVYGLTRGHWLHGFLAGITLAMAMLPEEFPVVLTVFLALGAWRIAQEQVLTRRVPAIETLGAATVLCVDKTGTLTQNQMMVQKLYAGGEFYTLDGEERPLPEACHELVEFAILASQRDPFDPMDKALKNLGATALARTEHLHEDWELVQEYPLSPNLLALSHVWRSPDGEDYVIAAKGAPEAIADLCHLDEATQAALEEPIRVMAAAGLRVLGVARAAFRQTDLPEEQHAFVFEFLGLVGFADPIRPTVPAAIAECHRAGIRVVMITGDYPVTAANIARQIGIEPADRVLTGPEVEQMDAEELARQIGGVNIFARMVPEQKLRLVQALKANGEVVAMTGDGVNDAPALKAAHIGIAMGGRGTDVAREAADLVLLDDDFSSIKKAVQLGRRIFDNLRKAMAYIFAVHIPIAGISLLPVLFHWPLLLLPVHIAFLELIIDPACSLVFEAEAAEKDVMRRPPRRPDAPFFSRRLLGLSSLQGLSVLGIITAVFFLARLWGHGEAETRALTFTTLIVANLALIITNASWSRGFVATLRNGNTALRVVLLLTLFFLGLVLFVPGLRVLFRFAPLHPGDLLVSLGSGLASVLWFELLKSLHSRKQSESAL